MKKHTTRIRRARMATREHLVLVTCCMLTGVGVLAGMAGQVRASMYVVDQAAPGAADTNPGTEDKPFKTVQHAADVAQPGDTIYVMAGKYDERVRVKTSGTEGKPIAFVARPRRAAVVRGFDLEAGYIRVEGFEIDRKSVV
jgi:pectin methylesterase-like acyl-CoA thioesterase